MRVGLTSQLKSQPQFEDIDYFNFVLAFYFFKRLLMVQNLVDFAATYREVLFGNDVFGFFWLLEQFWHRII